MKEIHILTTMFGAKHCYYFSETMLSSLIKSLDGIHKEIPTKHFVYCTPDDIFDTHQAEWEVTIDRDIIKESPRENLYKAILTQLQISIAADATIVLAMADHVYGNGLRELLENHHNEYVVCSHGRIRASAFDSVKAFIPTAFSNSEFAFNNYNLWQHPMVDYGLQTECKYWRAKRSNSHIDVYFKEPSPVLFKATTTILDIMRDKEALGRVAGSTWGTFETIDHDCVDYFFKNGGLYYCKDSNEFIWTEFTDDDNYIPTVPQIDGVNDYWNESAQFFHKTPYRVIL